MSEELKPCPFCGGTKICTEKGINLNYCDNCSAESNIEHWDTRPIEDELQKRIAELTECIGSQMADVYTLKARIAELEMKIRHNALWQASEDAEERAHLEKLVPDLKKRIAELEAERLELRKTLGWAYDLDEYKDNPEVQRLSTKTIRNTGA